MTEQLTNHIMMVRPIGFKYNEQTAENNFYQKDLGLGEEDSQAKALKQFDAFVAKLRNEGLKIVVFEDSEIYSTPDAIFPNNWISFHTDGKIRLYPMYAKNRRLERRKDFLDYFKQNYSVSEIVSYTKWENKNVFLEGTGSLIFDRKNKIAYAGISKRTNPAIFNDFSKESGFKIISFKALQSFGKKRKPIYHTNVMMCLGEKFAVVCLNAIDDLKERSMLINSLHETEKEIIEISPEQVKNFAGNMLQLKDNQGNKIIVMSSQAYTSLDHNQLKKIELQGKIIHSDIITIETLGGGSARCMIAEIFNPKLN